MLKTFCGSNLDQLCSGCFQSQFCSWNKWKKSTLSNLCHLGQSEHKFACNWTWSICLQAKRPCGKVLPWHQEQVESETQGQINWWWQIANASSLMFVSVRLTNCHWLPREERRQTCMGVQEKWRQTAWRQRNVGLHEANCIQAKASSWHPQEEYDLCSGFRWASMVQGSFEELKAKHWIHLWLGTETPKL